MKKICTCPKCGKAIDITDHNLIDTIPCMSCAEEFEPFEVKDAIPEGSPKWSISSFFYHKENDHMVIHLESETDGTIMAELSPDEIADFVNNH